LSGTLFQKDNNDSTFRPNAFRSLSRRSNVNIKIKIQEKVQRKFFLNSISQSRVTYKSKRVRINLVAVCLRIIRV